MQDVLDGVQNDGDDLCLLDDQEVTERLEGSCLHHSNYLLKVASSSQVGHSPHCLLLGFVLTLSRGDKIKVTTMTMTLVAKLWTT